MTIHTPAMSGRCGTQLAGPPQTARDRDAPWSAAAISFMVRKAALSEPRYSQFRFAAAHSQYIHDAIQRREAENTGAPFWGFRLHERKPQLGDIVCRQRITNVNYDFARTRDSFKSHCDIIVQIRDEPRDDHRRERVQFGQA